MSRKKESCFTNCDVYVRAALIVHAGFGSPTFCWNAKSLFLSETGKETKMKIALLNCIII